MSERELGVWVPTLARMVPGGRPGEPSFGVFTFLLSRFFIVLLQLVVTTTHLSPALSRHLFPHIFLNAKIASVHADFARVKQGWIFAVMMV